MGGAVGAPIALALVGYDTDAEAATLVTGDGERDAGVVDLPFIVGSDRSERAPRYE